MAELSEYSSGLGPLYGRELFTLGKIFQLQELFRMSMEVIRHVDDFTRDVGFQPFTVTSFQFNRFWKVAFPANVPSAWSLGNRKIPDFHWVKINV